MKEWGRRDKTVFCWYADTRGDAKTIRKSGCNASHSTNCTERRERGNLQLGWNRGAVWGPQGDVAQELAPDGEPPPPRTVQCYRQKGERLRESRREGQTEKGTFIKQNQSPDAPTFVVKLRSREKGEKEEHLAMGKGKQPTKTTGYFGTTSCLQALYS